MHATARRLTGIATGLTLAIFGQGFCAQGATGQAAPVSVAITHVTVIDVEHGRRLPDRTVLVNGNRIALVAQSASSSVPAGARVIDGRGKYLIPGLWDMHVHALRAGRSRWMFPLFIATGITGIRDTGSPLDSLLWYRKRVSTGEVLGPRIVGTGPLLDAPAAQYPYLTMPVVSAADGRRAVDSLADAGVNFIKTYNSLSRDAFFAIAAEARRRGIPIIGHVPYKVTAFEASDSGLKSIEHLTRVVDSCLPDSANRRLDAEAAAARKRPGMTPDSIMAMFASLNSHEYAAFDERLCEQAGAHFARNGTWQVPTQERDLHWTRAFLASDTTRNDPYLRYVPAAVIAFWTHYRDSVVARPFDGLPAQARYATKSLVIRALVRGGDGLLAGTDTDGDDSNIFGVPGVALHHEIEAFVRDVGLSPVQALRAATLGPAQFLDATDSLGTVAAGKLADLVLLDADPLLDIRNTRRIRAVVTNGRYFDRAALDSLLAGAEHAAASPPSRSASAHATVRASAQQISSLAANAMGAQAPEQAPERDVAIVGASVIDVAAGKAIPNQTVVVRGTRVVAMGSRGTTAVQAGALVVDGAGKFIIPGLWDMHGHIFPHEKGAPTDERAWHLPLYIATGVTGVRDMWTNLEDFAQTRAWNAAAAAGQLVAPIVVPTGPMIDGPTGIFKDVAIVVGSAADANRIVDSIASGGARALKIHNAIPREAFFALAARSRERGLPLIGHVPSSVTVREAIAAGQMDIEHSTEADGCASAAAETEAMRLRTDTLQRPPPGRVRQVIMDGYDARRCADLMKLLVARGIWVTPTLVVAQYLLDPADPSITSRDELRYVPAVERAGWDRTRELALRRMSPAVLETRRRVFAAERNLVGTMQRAGVRLMIGTDVANDWLVPGFSVHDELALFVRSGMTPAEALRAGTLTPARYLHATDSLGTVAAGKRADLVLLDGDPLADIQNTTRIRAVFVNGRYLDRATLDSMLSAAARVDHAAPAAARMGSAATPARSLRSSKTTVESRFKARQFAK